MPSSDSFSELESQARSTVNFLDESVYFIFTSLTITIHQTDLLSMRLL